jgi:proline-specific peptidase
MRRVSIFSASIVVLLLLSAPGCDRTREADGAAEAVTPAAEATGPASAETERESIHDRIVHIEPELITEIPDVPRLCGRLALTSHRIDVGDAELFVEEEGEGTPLVLINGGPGGTHHTFHPWFGRASEYARVIYYDQRGCGLSDREPGEDGYSVEQAVDDLDALRRGLGIDRWVVLGYSYGGLVAQLYNATYPEHLAGVVLLGASLATGGETGPSRQQMFLSERELKRRQEILREIRELADETGMSSRQQTRLLVYNNFINGDWKRQNYYKPSLERMAQIARYEWDHDDNFNGIVNRSGRGIDLAGAFDDNPVPTLILEGRWDLTWSEGKPGMLAELHPRAELVMFENAGHGIYDEEPDRFFNVLGRFIRELPEVPAEAVAGYAAKLPDWRAAGVADPDQALPGADWGWNSSRRLAARYTRDWLDQIDDARGLLRLGFALYDVENYDEAVLAFRRMERVADDAGERAYRAVALIWQAHMLDLLGRRDDAIATYRRAADMSLDDTWSHSQYGMRYSLSAYARERMTMPFERIENGDPS